jgi:hypothetical protein
MDGMVVSDTTYPIWYRVRVTDVDPPGAGATDASTMRIMQKEEKKDKDEERRKMANEMTASRRDYLALVLS